MAWRFYLTNTTAQPVRLDFIVRAEALLFAIAALLTPGIFWAARRYPLARGNWLRAIPTHVLAGAVFALLLKGLWDVAMTPLYRAPWTVQFTWAEFRSSLLAGLQPNLLRYWMAVIGITAMDQARRSRRTEIEAAKLRAELAEARLESLRIQIDPHFLFNTLHGISSLVHSDPDTAELMIANLSDLLRRSLDQRERPEIPLAEELDFLRLYLDIQRQRFGQRLRVIYEVDSGATSCFVPGMILQPLAENAIRHAIACRRPGGWLRIGARAEGGELVLEVEDGGGQPPALPLSEGLGLRNTRERLERMYPGHKALELLAGPEGLLVRGRLPWRAGADRVDETRNAA
ncbi:MAG: histidine kinase [Bryobacteraceae bacterium]